jgi:rubrerythrin
MPNTLSNPFVVAYVRIHNDKENVLFKELMAVGKLTYNNDFDQDIPANKWLCETCGFEVRDHVNGVCPLQNEEKDG